MTEFIKQIQSTEKSLKLKPGDIYEDCAYHPVVCLGVDYNSEEIWGVSLIDGSYPRCCSLVHCGIRKLKPKEAWAIKSAGPLDAEDRKRINPKQRWWNEASKNKLYRVGKIGLRKKRHS
jgi:hypothetical protein